MKRKALGLWPCVAVLLIVSGCGHCKTYIDQAGDSKSQVTVTSFSLHFTQQEKEQNIKARLGAPFYGSLDPQDEKATHLNIFL